MKQDRRSFIRVGGLALAATGIVHAFLQSCKPGPGGPAAGESGSDRNPSGGTGFQDAGQGESLAAESLPGNMTEGIEPLSDNDYLARQEKIRGLMLEAGIDALWIEGGANMQYFYDVSWWMSERVFGALLPVHGEPVWICPAFEGPRAAERIRFGKDIRTWEEHESPYRLLDRVLRSQRAAAGKVALDPNLRNFVAEGIKRESNAEMVDGSMLINLCRGIKSEKELAFMDLANRITKTAFRWALSQIKPGMIPSGLRDLIASGHGQLGVSGYSIPLFGAQSAFPHGSKIETELGDGDIVLVDGGCSVEGYQSDVTRTVVCGTPNQRQKNVFEIVRKAQSAVHEAVRPGVVAGELDRIARKAIEDAGFGPLYKYFLHRLGHGIGLEGHEWPYLVKDNPLPLQAGMTLSNEPGIYLEGEFGIRIEDCFVVTEDGGQFLGGMLCRSLEDPFGD